MKISTLLYLSTGLALAAAQAKKIKIGFVTTLSGPNAAYGKDMRNSVELALQHMGGKMGGIPVEVIYEDDEQKPEVGKQKTDKLLQRDRVDFIAGYIWSNVLLASYKPVVDSKTFLISANAGPSQLAGEQCNPYFFAASWNNDQNPMGVGGMGLHEWVFPTRTFQAMLFGKDEGETGTDDDFAKAGVDNLGAWILGRNMFGPVRGPWPDDTWKGWWGDTPPYRCEVFVLTHHPRKPLEMKGGTVFHFVTDGIHAALDRARASAKGKDIRLGGGVAAVRQYLQAGLVDEMHLAVSPVTLGRGEALLAGIDLPALGFQRPTYVGTAKAAHYLLKKAS